MKIIKKHLTIKSLSLLCLALLLVGCGQPGSDDGRNPHGNDLLGSDLLGSDLHGFQNGVRETTPIIDQIGADPWVICHNDAFYYTKTIGYNITLYRSKYLSHIAAGESKVLLEENESLWDFWAPEIYFMDGTWYIYFAACAPDSDIHRMYVLSNQSPDPFEGEWRQQELLGMDDKFAIDGTVLHTKHDDYFIWSGWEGYENIRQDLYIARMISPTEVANEKILISTPEYDWEMHGNPLVNEGPQVIRKGNTINLVYSASGSWTNDYCLGLLTATASDDLCNPKAWKKWAEPVFSSANGIYGPGHCSFVEGSPTALGNTDSSTTPDNNQTYMIYHSARWDGSGWTRSVRMQPVTFDENGVLETSLPHASNVLIPLPYDEPSRLRGTAENLALSSELTVVSDADALSGKAITGFKDRSQAVEWTIDIPADGTYLIFAYAGLREMKSECDRFVMLDRMPDRGEIPAFLTANGIEQTSVLQPSEYYQPVCFSMDFEKGENTIRISFNPAEGTVDLDRIEIMPLN